MKDTILNRLNKIENLEQRKVLKDIMSGVFINLVNHQEDMNKSIKDRVYDEIELDDMNYDIYITISDKNKIDPIDDFLHPILESDVYEKNIKNKDIKESLLSECPFKLFTVFMMCEHEKMNQLINNDRSYQGEIITDKRSYKMQIKLQKNESYINEIEKLYYNFIKNNISWKTVNTSYLNKFIDVIITDCEEILEDEEIEKITFDLEEYEKYKVTNAIPLWNIKRLNLTNNGFPIPAEDKVNFEHVISLEKLGMDKGYLAEDENELIQYIMFHDQQLTIVHPEEKVENWNILQIVQPLSGQLEKYEYKVFSNRKKNTFLNNYLKKHNTIIRTKAEIKRLVDSFEISKNFKLNNIEITQQLNEQSKTYDMNNFIIDDIRIANNKSIMKLKFETHLKDNYIIYDLISFLVSEVQMYFPEYKCEGELI